jgi:hypothetical protein
MHGGNWLTDTANKYFRWERGVNSKIDDKVKKYGLASKAAALGQKIFPELIPVLKPVEMIAKQAGRGRKKHKSPKKKTGVKRRRTQMGGGMVEGDGLASNSPVLRQNAHAAHLSSKVSYAR